MTLSVKHSFQSAKADGGDTSLARPSDWNAEHALTMATGKILGRRSASTGAVEELDPSPTVRTITGAASIGLTDWGKIILLNSASAFTLSVDAISGLVSGWNVRIKNINIGLATVDPNSSETADGRSTIDAAAGEDFTLFYDGTALRTIGRTGLVPLLVPLGLTGSLSAAAQLDFALPAGFDEIETDFYDLQISSNAALLLRYATDGVPNFISGANYRYRAEFYTNAAVDGSVNFASATATSWVIGGTFDANTYINAKVTVQSPKTARTHTYRAMSEGVWNTGSVFSNMVLTGEQSNDTGAMTHLRYFGGAGNLTGNYMVRGRKRI